MEIRQKEDINFGFCKRFELARKLGSGHLGSFIISVQTIGKSKEAVTEFFVNKVHELLQKIPDEMITQNRNICNWPANGNDFITRVNQKCKELRQVDTNIYRYGRGNNSPTNLASEVLYHEVGELYLKYNNGMFQVSDDDDYERMASSLRVTIRGGGPFKEVDLKDDDNTKNWLRDLYKQDPLVKSIRDFKITFLKSLGAELDQQP